jgi:hypothetical protein
MKDDASWNSGLLNGYEVVAVGEDEKLETV